MSIAVCVDPQHVGKVWPRVDEFLRRSYERMENGDFDEMVENVIAGVSLLWLGWDGTNIISAFVTELRGDVCEIVVYGGKRADHLIETVENYARDEGRTMVRLKGRPGWARVFKNYHQPYVILERKL